MAFRTRELTPETFPDFENLALQQGGCWCMYYQRGRPVGRGLTRVERASMNRKDKERLVKEGRAHAVLVYDGAEPVGWCQYGPGEELPRIDAGRNYKKLARLEAEGNLWRVTCFFVSKGHRGMGVAKAGLRAALESIAEQGGGTVEAFPVVSKKMAAVPEWRWFGVPSMFEAEGFRKVAPLGTSLVLMRKVVRPRSVARVSRAQQEGRSR